MKVSRLKGTTDEFVKSGMMVVVDWKSLCPHIQQDFGITAELITDAHN